MRLVTRQAGTLLAIIAGLALFSMGVMAILSAPKPSQTIAPPKPATAKPAPAPAPPPPRAPPEPPKAVAPAAVSPAVATPPAAVPLPKERPASHRRRRRVEYEPGGPAFDCGLVRFAIQHFSQAEIDALASANPVTPQQRAAARRCLRKSRQHGANHYG